MKNCNINPINHLSRPTAVSLMPAVLFALVLTLPLSARAADRGNANTSDGAFALGALTTGADNTGIGYDALRFTDTGRLNTGVGAFALQQNTSGNSNTAVGVEALFKNTASSNTAVGRISQCEHDGYRQYCHRC